MSRSWGIVGGGLLGMTLALRLSKAGDRVTIFEDGPALGGLAAPWQLGDVTWDRHYHVTLLSDLALRGLLEELGLDERMRWAVTRTGFYVDGRLYPFNDVADFMRFPPLSLVEKARLGATILLASKIRDWHALEELTAIEWLRRYSGAGTVEKIWRPLLRAKLGPNAERASAAFIWAIIARMYAARRTGMKREMFGYVEGGYANILASFEALLKRIGVEVRTSARVTSVERSGDGGVCIETAAGSDRFDNVVVTLASPLTARVCSALSEREREAHSAVEYQGIVCASLLLDEPLAGYYVTNITDRWVPFTAVIEMTALIDREFTSGRSLVYLPKYLTPADPAFDLTDDELQDEFLRALLRMYPHFRREQVRAFRVSRVKYVLPISTVGYSHRVPPIRTSVPGLYTVNSAHIVNGTLNVNETVQLAERTATELLAS